MTKAHRALLTETARSLRGPLLLLLGYLVVRAAFGLSSEHGGLVTPEGKVNLLVLVLGVLTLVLRLIVLFVLPAVVVHHLAARVLRPSRVSPSPTPVTPP